ncbi:hypothetical protein H5410_031520, partial [Solanum commersonii]
MDNVMILKDSIDRGYSSPEKYGKDQNRAEQQDGTGADNSSQSGINDYTIGQCSSNSNNGTVNTESARDNNMAIVVLPIALQSINFESNEEQIYIDADISPRVIKAVKSARNGKKQ